MDSNVYGPAAIPNAAAGAPMVEGVVAIVKAYLASNHLEASAVPAFIRDVYASLASAGGVEVAAREQDSAGATPPPVEGGAAQEHEAARALPTVPVVPVEESVQQDYLVCLFDGKRGKMLKRHLRARYGMEWEDYCRHWNLPADYPSVAPGYSMEKSRVAKSQGLGRTVDKTPKTAREAVPMKVAA